MSRPRPLNGLCAAIAAAAILNGVLTACGGSGEAATSTGAKPASVLHGSLQYTDCSDWNGGAEAAREATILSLRRFYAGEVSANSPGSRHALGPVLGNQQAYTILQHACAVPFARAFKLYKLYGRAAGFAGRAP